MTIKEKNTVALLTYDSRSGSTLLAAMLDACPGISVLPETSFIGRMYAAGMDRESDLTSQTVLDFLFDEPHFRELELSRVAVAKHLNQQKPCTIENTIYAVADAFRDANSIPPDRLLVLKSNRAFFYAEQLNRDAADIPVIFIIRDGRAVFRSKRETISSLGRRFSRSVISSARHWVLLTTILDRQKSRIHTVRFEDLVQAPQATVSALLDGLGLPPVSSVSASEAFVGRIGDSQRHLHGNIGQPNPALADAWRKSLPAHEIRLYEQHAGLQLAKWGYMLTNVELSTHKDKLGYFLFMLKDRWLMYNDKLLNLWYVILDGALRERLSYAIHRARLSRK